MLSGEKVLVTGATGFIGGRLVEKLILEHHADVRALVHSYTNGSRIARFNLEMMAGDIADEEIIDRAVSGCEVVFHLAHDRQSAQNNIDAVRILSEACLRHGVQHLVHTSSIAVYEPLPDGDLNEDMPATPTGWEYAECKLAEEDEILRHCRERGLPATVVLPTIVYGPYGKRWTSTTVQQLLSGQLYLPDGGQGLCNPVYVDDLVDAMILAAESEAAVGERFMISGPAPVTWQKFYSGFEKVLGVHAQVHMTSENIERLNKSAARNIRLAFKDPVRVLRWQPLRRVLTLAIGWRPLVKALRLVRAQLNDDFTQKLQQKLPQRQYVPEGQVLALYRSRCYVRIDKARQLLGYEPKFDFDRGMELTGQFIRWAYPSRFAPNTQVSNES